ncbi:PIN domain-containing protein [Pyrococcus yayanosii]|uniref:hypothetical protein n=1 Tax=Pyrococcus yayanosii TaxID=1008460 RepID=UPI001ED905A8|nr:hypothetical protein [Pyrococcus yayanosii]
MWFFKNNGLSLKEAKEMLNEYTSDPRSRNLREDANIVRKALLLLEEEKLSLSRFNDAILATFDKKLRKLAKRRGVKTI